MWSRAGVIYWQSDGRDEAGFALPAEGLDSGGPAAESEALILTATVNDV
jgi:hypothetical protein